MSSTILEVDMIRHRKIQQIIQAGLIFCDGNLNSPRANYFGIDKLQQMKYKLEIKLLVQVPDSFTQEILTLCKTQK